jgi:putative ABC transport system substrate-binding protein
MDGTRSKLMARALLLALLAALPSTESAAQTLPVLGYLATANDAPDRLASFRQGLRELGYVEGTTIAIEFRYAMGADDYDGLAGELVGRPVTILVATNAPAAVAARKATTTLPIVLAAVNDPVRLGLVQSLEHPGTNVTGTTMYAPQLIADRLRTLQRIVPGVDKVAMLVNGGNANNAAQVDLLAAEAQKLGIAAATSDVRAPADIERAFAKARESGAKGLLNAVDNFINSQRAQIAAQAAQAKLPMVYSDREYVLAGGLMAIGPGHLEGFHGAAKYVDQILRGANPADLPVAATKRIEVTVNRSALDRLGLTLPKEVSDRVTEWVD